MDARMRRDAYACPAPVPPGRRPTQPQSKSGIRVVSIDQIAFGFSIAGGITRYRIAVATTGGGRGPPHTQVRLSRGNAGVDGMPATGINTEACNHTCQGSTAHLQDWGTQPQEQEMAAHVSIDMCCHAGNQSVWLVAVAIHLLIEGLGIERIRRTGNTGDQQQSRKSGRNDLHGYLSFGPLVESS